MTKDRGEKVNKFFKGKRCLVTGSDGFVGRHLVRRLEEAGAKVFTADRNNGLDITDARSFSGKFPAVDIVFHLASLLRGIREDEIFRNNVMGNVNVLEFCRMKHSKLVYFSSFIYGKPKYLPIDESHPVESLTAYSESKVMGEELCHCYNKIFGTEIVILRPFNIYGSGQRMDFVIPKIIEAVFRKRDVFLEGGNSKRDFVYIDDAIEACLKAAMYHGRSFEIFNIGSGSSTSIRDVVKIVAGIMKRNVNIHFSKPLKEEYIKETCADIGKAKRLLGWKPRYTIKNGIYSMLKGKR